VFSPYYFWAGRSRPEDHVCINVALYGPGVGRWAMTERAAGSLSRGADHFQVAASSLAWDGACLEIDVAETCAPVPFPLRGKIRLTPESAPETAFALDPASKHHWRPIAPYARAALSFSEPSIAWSGPAYWDSNWAEEPIEAGFRSWTWSRVHEGTETIVLYDTLLRDGSAEGFALRFGADGAPEALPPPPRATLPRGFWGVARETRADAGAAPRVSAVWEDAPFYTRSALATRLYGRDGIGVHESLDCDRLKHPIVRAMLPVRMPRRR
jgi:carotenoid 1,2-hydratase